MPRVIANVRSATPRHGKIRVTFALMFMKAKGYEYSGRGKIASSRNGWKPERAYFFTNRATGQRLTLTTGDLRQAFASGTV
jgi:hypothetical protein